MAFSGKEAQRRLAELRDDAYLLVLKCLVGKGYSLKADLLMSKLRKELCVSESRHSELRAQLANGTLGEVTVPRASQGNGTAGQDNGRRALGSASKSKSKRQKVTEPHEQAPGAFLGAPGSGGVQLDPLIGYKVTRYWPSHGGWFEGIVSDYNAETGEHCIIYDAGTKDETYEWFDVRHGKESEVKQLGERADVLGVSGHRGGGGGGPGGQGGAATARAPQGPGGAAGAGLRPDQQRKRGGPGGRSAGRGAGSQRIPGHRISQQQHNPGAYADAYQPLPGLSSPNVNDNHSSDEDFGI